MNNLEFSKVRLSPMLSVNRRKSTTECIKNTVNISQGSIKKVAIGIPNFSKTEDTLTVNVNYDLLILDKDYTISEDSKYILAVGNNVWNPNNFDVTFIFKVLKEINIVEVDIDGNLLVDETVGENKLDKELKDKVNEIGNLKETILNLETRLTDLESVVIVASNI